jgi:hypothetical protein
MIDPSSRSGSGANNGYRNDDRCVGNRVTLHCVSARSSVVTIFIVAIFFFHSSIHVFVRCAHEDD